MYNIQWNYISDSEEGNAMKRIGAMKLRRLLACLMTLMLALTALPVSAQTLAGWEGVEVSVLLTDAAGNTWQYPAVQAPQEEGVPYAWWVTLPPEALNTTLQAQILHADPAYSYWAPDWTLNLHWAADKDALSLDDLYAYYIGYSYNGVPQVSQMQDCMKLYLSTQQPPFAYEAEEGLGGAVMLPAGEEGFGSTPGAELITPDVDFITPGVEAIVPGGQQPRATITVEYVHVDGRLLDSRRVTLEPGTHTLWPESDKVGGLNLAGDYSAQVTVYDDGYTDTASVTFLYEDAYVAPIAPAQATVEVYYYHQDGYELDRQLKTLTPGYHTLRPESSRTAGFELVTDDAVQVYVDERGWTDTASVSFIYRDVAVAPVSGEVTVMYVLEDGTVIDNQVVTVARGSQTLAPESTKVGGLTLVSDAYVSVYVDGGGAVSPNPVQFVYRRPAQQANVTVFIYDSYGREIAPRIQQTLPVGMHMIEAPAGNELPGYELISEAIIYVTVNPDGSYSPNGEELSFWYRENRTGMEETIVPDAPVSQHATVTVRYLDSRSNQAIITEQQISLGNGSHTLTPDMSLVPAGYTVYAGTEAQTVNVRSGMASPATVTFYFNRPQETQAPSVFDVTVHYYDTLGNEIAPRQTQRLAPGTHWIQANPQNLPAGYELASESAFQLTVYADGSYDRAAEDVGFWYAQKQVQPQSAEIVVNYVDGSGRSIAGPYRETLAGGQSYVISPDASVVPPAYDISGAKPVTVNVSAQGVASPAVVSFVAQLRRETAEFGVGESVQRYGVVNANSVAMRSEPYSTKSNTVMQRVPKGGLVYVVASEYNTAGEIWSQVIVDGRTGYMKAEYIDVLTQAASDVYANSVGATPVPTFTPAPTPTESFVEYITPAPVTPAPFVGYAVLNRQTGLRTGTGSGEMTLKLLPEEELVVVSENVRNSYTGETWSYVRTLDNLQGYVPAANLRQVSQQEADWRIDYWQQQHGTPTPTVQITNTPEPEQLQGYGWVTTGNAVLRSGPAEWYQQVTNLPYGTVVFISGQTYVSGTLWHAVTVERTDGSREAGYVRGDLARLMTEQEELLYINSLNQATPTATPTRRPYGENDLSSSGYVTTNNVNFRAEASTSSGKLGTLHTYAMATVLGTERRGNVTWYRVNYNNTVGYIHGDYFHQLTYSELQDFYADGMYRQGLINNGGSADDESPAGPGGQISQEDQVVDDWYSGGGTTWPVLPENPEDNIPTATPTPTLPATLPGYVNRPTNTPATMGGTIGGSDADLPLPGGSSSVTYPVKNEGGASWIWWIVIPLLALTIGGAIALMQHQRRKQQIAMKAAQRRAQQARSAGARPYARQTAAQPRTGAYPSYGQNQAAPLFPQPEEPQRPYARQTGEAQPRVGRRTAWQQAHGENQQE